MLIPIAPLAALPPIVGLLLNALVSLIVLMLVSRRLKLTPWEFFLLAVSPMHLQSMIFGNIEWLPLMGLLFPAPIALLFFSTIPQSTLGFIVLMLFRQWKASRWKGMILRAGADDCIRNCFRRALGSSARSRTQQSREPVVVSLFPPPGITRAGSRAPKK